MEDKSQRHNVDFYNLYTIISVGYRVSTPKATKFRQWVVFQQHPSELYC